MKNSLALCALVVSLLPVQGSDAKSVEIANAMTTAMGGMDNWNRAHFVRYDFKVSIGGKTMADRAHLWDKMTGRYRLEAR
ncbi:MAG: hypothetical protein H7039_08775, partial [Bryobacteraceae bacterium]|nr:hypothetical protein [Bryobacteraceae bacterium]